MTTLISHLRRKPIGLLGLLLQIPLFVLSAPSGFPTAVHLARDSEEPHPVGALYCKFMSARIFSFSVRLTPCHKS